MDSKIDLKTILALHAKWRMGKSGGTSANLSGADLRSANLSGAGLRSANLSGADLRSANLRSANLSGADLSGADLSGADLSGAGLSRANLSGANLSGADLRSANLRSANLSGADLSGADLSGADLSRANLSGADLRSANLSGANLSGANLSRANLSGANLKNCKQAELALAMTTHLPEGPFIGWKKCMNGVIVKLRIPEKARRSHGATRKCRAEFVTVLEVFGATKGVSIYDKATEYHPGKTVKANGWNEDRWETCGQGIHFFITRLEAEAFEM